jgi:hypothetical protein
MVKTRQDLSQENQVQMKFSWSEIAEKILRIQYRNTSDLQ